MRPPPDKDAQKKLLDGRIPLVIGVTGHRDIRENDEPDLRREIAAAIKGLKQDYLSDDPNTPIVVLSALAEGADSLVAEIALDLGCILIAPFPMEEAEYRRDFGPQKALRPDAEARFGALRACALGTIEMPYRDDSSRELVQSTPEKRDRQYLDVGLYIALHCHVLLALSNGAKGATGGTSDVVSFKRDGIPYEYSENARMALDGSEIGPFIEIATPRIKDNPPLVRIETKKWGFGLAGTPPQGLRRFIREAVDTVKIVFGHHAEGHQSDPINRAWSVFYATANQTRRFNHEAASLDTSALKKSLRGIFTDYADGASPDRRAEKAPIRPPKGDMREELLVEVQDDALSVAPRWCDVYQRADALALKWQRNFKRDWRKLFTGAFVAICLFEIYAHLWHFLPLLFLYVGAIGFGFFLFSQARARQHQERFLDYRALAEATRVAVYWKAARIDDHVSGCYPIKQPSELAWVKIVVRALDMLDNALGPRLPSANTKSLDGVRRLWLVGQWAYFSGASRQRSLVAEQREWWSLIALGASPFIGALALAIYFVGHHEALGHHGRDYVVAVMGLFVGLGAVIAGHTEQLAFKAQGRQYERMSLLFERALLLVNKAINSHHTDPTPDEIEEVHKIYLELGAEAMKEHADWVAIYRQRPIRPAG